MKTGDKILYGVILVLLLASVAFVRLSTPSGAVTATITVDGNVYDSFNLTAADDRSIRIDYNGGGHCILEVSAGRIRVRESTCPNQICVKTGWIENPGQMIVCLPHRMVVELSGDVKNDIDGRTF